MDAEERRESVMPSFTVLHQTATQRQMRTSSYRLFPFLWVHGGGSRGTEQWNIAFEQAFFQLDKNTEPTSRYWKTLTVHPN